MRIEPPPPIKPKEIPINAEAKYAIISISYLFETKMGTIAGSNGDQSHMAINLATLYNFDAMQSCFFAPFFLIT